MSRFQRSERFIHILLIVLCLAQSHSPLLSHLSSPFSLSMIRVLLQGFGIVEHALHEILAPMHRDMWLVRLPGLVDRQAHGSRETGTW